MCALTKIILQLGRNPASGFPEGDRKKGYIINAPLGVDGKLDPDLWKQHKKECTVVRYSDEEDRNADGFLTRRGNNWYINYDEDEEVSDENLYHFADHRLWVGDYVTINDDKGRQMIFEVAETL